MFFSTEDAENQTDLVPQAVYIDARSRDIATHSAFRQYNSILFSDRFAPGHRGQSENPLGSVCNLRQHPPLWPCSTLVVETRKTKDRALLRCSDIGPGLSRRLGRAVF